MKKSLLLAFAFVMGCLLAPAPGSAAFDPTTISAPLEKSRLLAIALGRVTDRPTQDTLVGQIEAASVEVDTALAAAEKDPTLPPDMVPKLEEFKAIWVAFRKNRKEEIIPKILAGNIAEARRESNVVQLGRYRRMMVLLAPTPIEPANPMEP